jgi:hypothetical protein
MIKQILLSTCLLVSAQEPSQPKEVAAVLAHILKNQYLEVYNDQHYRIRVRGWAYSDIDGDGLVEVFILIDPHYHQSAPIQIYRIQKNGSILRLRESLAPGRLIARDDQRLDPHTLALAVDMTAVKPEGKYMNFAKSLSDKTHVVVYKNFIHSDMPKDEPGFLDMTSRDEFTSQDKCEFLQFSQPEAIEVGEYSKIPGAKVLAAMMKDEIILYRISKISPEGFLEKSITTIPRPRDSKFLLCLPNGQLGVELSNGQRLALAP